MNLDDLYIKAGWIAALRQVAGQLPNEAAITALAPVTVADATDATTAAALANANKAAINAIIAALKNVA